MLRQGSVVVGLTAFPGLRRKSSRQRRRQDPRGSRILPGGPSAPLHPVPCPCTPDNETQSTPILRSPRRPRPQPLRKAPRGRVPGRVATSAIRAGSRRPSPPVPPSTGFAASGEMAIERASSITRSSRIKRSSADADLVLVEQIELSCDREEPAQRIVLAKKQPEFGPGSKQPVRLVHPAIHQIIHHYPNECLIPTQHDRLLPLHEEPGVQARLPRPWPAASSYPVVPLI